MLFTHVEAAAAVTAVDNVGVGVGHGRHGAASRR